MITLTWRTLTLLAEQGPLSTTAVAEALDRTSDQASALLDYIASTGRLVRDGKIGQVNLWKITDRGRTFLDDFGHPQIVPGSLSHQLLALASGEPQTAREFQARLERRTGLDSDLAQISNKLGQMTERRLLAKGDPRPVQHAPAAHTYLLTSEGEDALDRLPVPA